MAVRETLFLLASVLVSAIAAWMWRCAHSEFAHLATAIVLPIVFSLLRVFIANLPDAKLGPFRYYFYQICLGLAFVLLLFFEMALGLVLTVEEAPKEAWFLVLFLGISYVLAYSATSSSISSHPRILN